MTRRNFLLAQALAAQALRQLQGSATEATQVPSIAITMDDFNLGQAWPESAIQVNRRLLNLLDRFGVRITLFVIGRNAEDSNNRKLLDEWADAGHAIANHTYSHFTINSPQHSLADFETDFLKAERILAEVKNYRRMFRFPALKEGNTVELRDGMRTFLDKHGYRNGHVTVDTSDWYYSSRLTARLRGEPSFSADRFEAPYVDHVRNRSLYYDDLARKVLGRAMRHTLLVHYSYLNACFLGSVLAMYKEIGWRIVNSDDAFADPVFQTHPQTLPAGESLVWALAKQTGRYDSALRYPGEDGAYEKQKLDALGI